MNESGKVISCQVSLDPACFACRHCLTKTATLLSIRCQSREKLSLRVGLPVDRDKVHSFMILQHRVVKTTCQPSLSAAHKQKSFNKAAL